MSVPCHLKFPEKAIFPGVTEYRSKSCEYFSWQWYEKDVWMYMPICEFGIRHNPDIKTTEISAVPIRPPLRDDERVVERPEDCPIGTEDKTGLMVFTVGKIPTGESYQTTLEGLFG